MPTYEGLRLKILKYWRLGLANYRKNNSSPQILRLFLITVGVA